MGDAWKNFLLAIKGNRDLLALLGIGFIVVIALISKVVLVDTLATGFFLGLLWLVFRFGMSHLHAKEELREFRKDAKLEAVKTLAKHVPKGDIRGMIENLMKDVDK